MQTLFMYLSCYCEQVVTIHVHYSGYYKTGLQQHVSLNETLFSLILNNALTLEMGVASYLVDVSLNCLVFSLHPIDLGA